ncbi:MAG TPA: AAA family ATPase [Kofleriaceae bacterium]|jgi:predicted ATPase/signal transduction histidine kinase
MTALADYNLVARLHSSPRSRVDRAIRIGDGTTVVVKQPAGQTTALETARRVERELEILMSVQGDGVIGVRGVVRDRGGVVGLVLESVGSSLASWTADHRPALEETLAIGSALARTLARIHGAGIIHKDINPNNVVYDPATGVVKVIDFDLAARTRAGTSERATSLQGTLAYLSPEQTGRLALPIDGRSDLYSLGATLFELLVGHPPFETTDTLAFVHALLATHPPRVDEVNSTIPSPIADIVAKLLAKAPEQRYQTAAGLSADLDRCRAELAATERIEPFTIAQHDVTTRFGFSERLYGREPEVRALADAFERTRVGSSESVLVSGYSGVGKSSVVREIHASVALAGGFFASGKFEQLHRDVPYSAVRSALDELLVHVLSDPDIERWREAIAAAVGDDAPLVCSLVPALEHVIGERSVPTESDPDVTRRRLAGGLARLIQVFAQPSHPLVLFFDDMQWADSASIDLVTRVLTSERAASLLVIEAYRHHEVDATHPFAVAIQARRRDGVTTSQLALAPLSVHETAELVADVLRTTALDAAPIIWRKTEGNPFFIRQFMHALYEDGHIRFDVDRRVFLLDTAALDDASITDNVADLLARKLAKLPVLVREVVVTAAAIGTRFKTALLAIVAGVTDVPLREALSFAVEAGMIEPTDGDGYRFSHDRLQEGAYTTLAPEERARLHLDIARLLPASPLGPDVFDVAHHYNLGRSCITDVTERKRFVELAKVASSRARGAGAFDVALKMMRSACELSDPITDYATWFTCHYDLVDVLSLAGHPTEAVAAIAAVRPHATRRDRATLDILETTVSIGCGHNIVALASARRAAAELDVELSTDPAELERQLGAEIAAAMTALGEHPIEAWIDFPAMTDPDKLAAMGLLRSCIPAAYQVEPLLLALICAKLVGLSLRHGNCAESARGYASFSIVLWKMGEYDLAYRFGRVGVELVRRLGAIAAQPSIDFTFAAFASPWKRPLTEAIALLRATSVRALEVGDVPHAAYAPVFTLGYLNLHGAPLAEVLELARSHGKLCAKLGLVEGTAWVEEYERHARSWMEVSPEQDLDFATTVRNLEAAKRSPSLIASFGFLHGERRYWRGDHAGVLHTARTIEPLVGTTVGNPTSVGFRFYQCLASISVGAPSTDTDALRAELGAYATACPHNFGAMVQLIDAELARASGDIATAMIKYDAAIEAAVETGFTKVAIIAHELAAQFWIERNKPAFAAVHCGKARDLCEQWGALPKARELELRARRLGGTSNHSVTTRSVTSVAEVLDFATIVKASQTIATDMSLDTMLAKIMAMIIENTGAQTGTIVLERESELHIHASMRDGSAASVTRAATIETNDASVGIIKYVTRTAEAVVLDDASRHARFRNDPYVRERRPRSVLCLPIVHNEHTLGAVYLENNLVTGAFTIDRLEALRILVSQLAISIENATMFARLEGLVAERTRALSDANRRLRDEANARERMESELRLGQKLQAVGQLAAGIAHEINTPIQFVGDSVAFLQDAFSSMLAVVDAFGAAIDPATQTIDMAAVERAAHDHDLDYIRANAPQAWQCALGGVHRVARIVGAMRAFSHPDQELPEPTSVNRALESTLIVAGNEYRHVADVETDFGDIPDIDARVGEISQVFLNLIVNAAHAIESVVGNSGERGKITVRTRLDGDAVVIAISDTGSGIPEPIRDRIFDPFFTTKAVGRGTGQGLALARTAIVDRHGGTLTFETRAGSGTTFLVRLPSSHAVRQSAAS